MGNQTARARRKRLADRNKTWNVHLGGMVFPFPTQWAAQDFVDTVLTEHVGMEYTIEQDDLTGSPIMTVEG